MTDSICVSWISSEKVYRITILVPGKELITKFGKDMEDVIRILKEVENAA